MTCLRQYTDIDSRAIRELPEAGAAPPSRPRVDQSRVLSLAGALPKKVEIDAAKRILTVDTESQPAVAGDSV
jgi:hypothetical protein